MTLPVLREYQEFNDSESIADYAREAVETLFRATIISGKPGNIFDPQNNATRAEFAIMLMNFL
jgi:hypothetical protein